MQGIQLQHYLRTADTYKFNREIGKGAYGRVYLATDLRTGKEVAVKEINGTIELRDQKSFMREIQIGIQARHMGLLPLTGFFIGDGAVRSLVVTEFMPNGTLQQAVKRRLNGPPLPAFGPTEWSKAIFGIAATMAHFHGLTAIHRDLKTENVLFDANWEIRIADFGLARFVTNTDVTGAIGTPLYMAPELIENDSLLTNALDVFAFGVLMHQTFTQSTALGDDVVCKNHRQFMNQVCRGSRLKRPPGIMPDDYWNLIQQCWDQAPADRPTFARIVEILRDNRYAIPGTDLARLEEYRVRICQPPAPPERRRSALGGSTERINFLASSRRPKS
jgi:serine/threonine protein kinase